MITTTVAASAAFIATGCGKKEKLDYDGFQLIQQHASTEGDVTRAIGEPTERLNRTWIYVRPEQHLNVIIEFDQHGRVARKQWIDATNRSWHDSDDAMRD